jgi:putative thiamine transport system permease protein
VREGLPEKTLRAAVLVIAALALFAPILAGLWHSAGAALGHFPVLGKAGPSIGPLTELLAQPGFATALRLTLVTGFAATILSLLLAIALAAAITNGPARIISRLLAPFLAMPHAAMAVGLAFMLAPSGWIARALAPFLGWARPPDLASVNDAFGAALILGLVIKETPFLLLIILAALTQVPLRAHLNTAQSLGYGLGAIWVKVIVPQLWPLIRLPLYVVLIYNLSVIDMALILGPSNPPTAAVLIARMFSSPDLAQILPASAGAILLGVLAAASIGAMWGGVRAITCIGPIWVRRGARDIWINTLFSAVAMLGAGLLVLGASAIVSLFLWSLAWRWPWPMLLPESVSLAAWASALGDFGPALQNTALIALASTAISLALAVAWLETQTPSRREVLIYLPLLIPQISFLFGMNTLLLQLGAQGSVGAVIWAHMLFVFPYTMIALTGPWRGLDPRYGQAAASLGAGRLRQLWAVKLPMLLTPICAAVAIGVAVSVAQYLPTLFLGAGRIGTLTTEAVTLASSSDRRITGVVTSLQAALPFSAYLLAFIIPKLAHKNRSALQGAAA